MKIKLPPARRVLIAAAAICVILGCMSAATSALKSDEQRYAELKQAHDQVFNQDQPKQEQ